MYFLIIYLLNILFCHHILSKRKHSHRPAVSCVKNSRVASTFNLFSFNFLTQYIHTFSFGSIRAEQRNHFMYDQLVEPFHIMCKELQTNMYIAKNNKYTVQNNRPLLVKGWKSLLCVFLSVLRYFICNQCIDMTYNTYLNPTGWLTWGCTVLYS